MKNIFYGLTFLIVFYSCSQQLKQNKLVDITSRIDKASGFVDLALTIVDKNQTDSTYLYIAQGLYKLDTVGIEISLKKNLKAGIVNGEMKNVFVNNGITIKSIGIISDRLLKSMTELYGVDSIGHQMRNDLIVLTCANLNQQDLNYSSGEYKFKVFMESEDDYAELFVDFDFSNNLILLSEKDVEYRKGVLKYLMKK